MESPTRIYFADSSRERYINKYARVDTIFKYLYYVWNSLRP